MFGCDSHWHTDDIFGQTTKLIFSIHLLCYILITISLSAILDTLANFLDATIRSECNNNNIINGDWLSQFYKKVKIDINKKPRRDI